MGLGYSPSDIDRIIEERRSAAAKFQDQKLILKECRRPTAEEQDKCSDRTVIKRGETADYIMARLKRDHPDIAQDLADGKYPSYRAAAIAAGIIKTPSVLDQVTKLMPLDAPPEINDHHPEKS
ncbi:MAG: hypothetical protein HQK58_16655 [Deltaproteobacteria bacterium]|nr:hypothetical protein [Deltaproteobacteria bacterium]